MVVQKSKFHIIENRDDKLELHSHTLIPFAQEQQGKNQNFIVEPSFTLFRQGITAARIQARLDKPWVPVMRLKTTNDTVTLPRSFYLVHCAMLEIIHSFAVVLLLVTKPLGWG